MQLTVQSKTEGPLCRVLNLSHCGASSSLVLCPASISYLGLPELQCVLVSLFKAILCALVPKAPPSGKPGGNQRVPLLWLFFPLRSLSIAAHYKMPEKICFRYFVKFSWLLIMGEQVLYQVLLRVEAEVPDIFMFVISDNSHRPCQVPQNWLL